MIRAEASGIVPRSDRGAWLAYSQAVLGFALLYGACVSFYYRSWLFGGVGVADTLSGNLFNSSISVASLVLAGCVGMRFRFKGMTCVLAGIALLAAASVLACNAVAGAWVTEAYTSSIVVAGVGMGLALPCCYELFSRYASSWIALAYGVVAAVGMLCGLVAECSGPMVLLMANLAFLLASVVLLVRAHRGGATIYEQSSRVGASDKGAASKARSFAWSRFFDSFLVAAVSVFAISMVYGVLSATASGSDTPRAVAASMAQVAGLLVGVLFLVYFGLKKRTPSTMLFNLVFGVLGAAILLLPFLQSPYPSLLYAFASGAWKLMLLVLLYLVAITPARSRRELLVGLALACALPRVGLSVGSFMANSLNISIESEFMRLTAIAVVFLYVLLMVVWFINSHERKQAENRANDMDEMLKRHAASQEDVRDLRLEAIAVKAELTNRERDVLMMMARGRDLAYICDELCLSRNTVKGYQKSIYAKLGVHSKQEIIDLADRG